MEIAYLLRNNEINFILDSLNCGLIIVNSSGKVIYINKQGLKILDISYGNIINQKIDEILSNSNISEVISYGKVFTLRKKELRNISIFSNDSPIYYNGIIIGAVSIFQTIEEIEKISNELQIVKELNTELEAIFNASYDEIYVTDGKGITLKVNNACERLYGLKPKSLIGKEVTELEKKGIFNPSVTKLVLEQKQHLTILQTSKSGKKIIVTGNPVFNENGDIIRVVSTAKDVTEIYKLREELKEAQDLIKRYSEELTELRKEKYQFENIVVKSPQMQNILDTIERVSKVDSTVLLLGDSGVGKTLLAKHIHKISNRSGKPFVIINCGAIPESLIESELFGYEKGAFTGAKKEGKPGLIEMANEGTLFLDEIAEIPYHLQAKFLQVIQEKQLVRIGGIHPITVDFRIIAATNKNIEKLVEEKKFREDLYYRLNVVPISIPSLRERKEDIQALIYFFLNKFNSKFKRNLKLSPLTLDYLLDYSWPGNIRELENIIERLVVTSKGKEIIPEDLPIQIKYQVEREKMHGYDTEIVPLKQAVERTERNVLMKAYSKFKNTYKMAEALKVSQPTIVRKMKKYLKNSCENNI